MLFLFLLVVLELNREGSVGVVVVVVVRFIVLLAVAYITSVSFVNNYVCFVLFVLKLT